ncbi:MAG: Crp/Fnr family transcriptional regulator [Kiloniellales bacterium]
MKDHRGATMPSANADHPDCLVEKFAGYLELSGAESMFLSILQSEERSVRRKQEVITQGLDSRYLYVLKHGWAHSYKLLASGHRQVLEFLLPGDFLGIREFAFEQALNFVVMSTDGVVCPFPKNQLSEMFNSFPRLTNTLVHISTREQAILIERICNIGGRSAYQRVGHQLLELWVRLRAVGLADGERFTFPIHQVVLADALGLSAVHVSRTLRRLRQDGLIELRNGDVALLDLPGLIKAAQFEEFYLANKPLDGLK